MADPHFPSPMRVTFYQRRRLSDSAILLNFAVLWLFAAMPDAASLWLLIPAVLCAVGAVYTAWRERCLVP